jgi:hypothetical protein
MNGRKRTSGTLNFHRSVSHPAFPPLPSSGESVQEEAAWAALKEKPMPGVPMQKETTMVPDHQGPVPMGGGGGWPTPIRDGLAQGGVAVVDALPCIDGIRVNEVKPRPEYASGGDASAPRSSRGPSSWSLGDATLGDVMLALRSSNIVRGQ